MLLQLILSKKRLRKARLLLKDYWGTFLHRIRSRGQSLSIHSAESPSGPCHHWEHKSVLSLPRNVLKNTPFPYAQDTYDVALVSDDAVLTDDTEENSGQSTENITVETTIAHTGDEYLGAYFYTNGVNSVATYTAQGQPIAAYSYPFNSSKHRTLFTSQRAQEIPGTTLSLYGDIASSTGNYFHWFVDGLPRLFLAQKFGLDDAVDHYLIPADIPDFVRDSLKMCDVDLNKIITAAPLELLKFEKLRCVSAPRGVSSCVVPGWAIDEYRAQSIKSTHSNLSKLYISRRDAGSRTFTNEDEVAALLESKGFKTVALSEYSLKEKIQLFANADVIVGLTGAGLTNLIFCSPNTKVLELMPSSNVTYLYTSICKHIGLNYQHTIFEHSSLISSINPYFGNFELDPRLLETALRQTQLI